MAIRSIFFYEVRPTRPIKDAAWRLDVPALVNALDHLPDETRLRPSEDSYEFAEVVARGTNPTVAFVRCRDLGLPMQAQQSTLEPFYIAADRKLAELTHAVFFPEHIIGAEYNHYGPRISSLAAYLSATVPQLLPDNERVTIASLVNASAMDVVRRAKSIKSIYLRAAPQLMQEIGQATNTDSRDFLGKMAAGYGVKQFGIDFRNRGGLDGRAILALVNWALEQGPGLLSAAVVRVGLEDGTSQSCNLLQTRIGAKRDMELMGPTARSISHESAHDRIVEVFDALGDQIKAASVLLGSAADSEG